MLHFNCIITWIISRNTFIFVDNLPSIPSLTRIHASKSWSYFDLIYISKIDWLLILAQFRHKITFLRKKVWFVWTPGTKFCLISTYANCELYFCFLLALNLFTVFSLNLSLLLFIGYHRIVCKFRSFAKNLSYD